MCVRVCVCVREREEGRKGEGERERELEFCVIINSVNLNRVSKRQKERVKRR